MLQALEAVQQLQQEEGQVIVIRLQLKPQRISVHNGWRMCSGRAIYIQLLATEASAKQFEVDFSKIHVSQINLRGQQAHRSLKFLHQKPFNMQFGVANGHETI